MIKQFIPQEVCLKCQGCCRFRQGESVWSPSLLDGEIENLLQNGLPPALISPQKKIRVVPFGKEEISICALFNPEENKCKIYALRPLECQLYPFLVSRNNDKIFLGIDLKCAFIREKQESLEFKAYVQYLSDLLNSPHYSEILKNNPQIIQLYPDTRNLRELEL